jgi:chemotaxis protein MotA
MLVIVGYLVVLGSIFGGYALAGGHLGALLQPLELLMIFGGALGAFTVANGMKTTKAVIKALPSIFKNSKFNKAQYMELLALLFEVLAKVRKEGLMAIESDVDDPHNSPLFSKYPVIVSDHHVIEFLTDYLRIMVGGNLNAMEIENLMDNEMETHHQEGNGPVAALSRMADGMPAFGIVAAVMGVVHVMENANLPPSELGLLVAHALVGTFLGILLGYGFVGPVGTLLEHRLNESSKVLECIKITLLASLNGYAPQVAVEFGRKVLYSTERPTFSELEEHVKQAKSR